MAEQVEQVLAAFLIDDPVGTRRFLKEIQRIDEGDPGVKIVDAAIADRTKRGRVKVHQTEDRGAAKGAARGTVIGVVVGTILLGPAGPAVGGVLGGTLGGLHNRIHDSGIDDKFMREVTSGIDKGKSVLFVLYEGDWSATIGAIQDLIKAEQAQLIQSTIAPEKAAALQALVATVVEELGGEEAIADFEVDTEAPADEAEQAADSEGSDDLTRIAGVDADASAALVGAGIVRYSQLASTSEPDTRTILTGAGVTAPDNVSTWAMQAAFAANGDWPGLDAYLRASQSDVGTSAPATGGAGTGSDDLTQLSGVGPKAAEALAKAGIATYASLAEANEPQVRHALHESDMTPPAGVGTWPMQASFAARGDWQGLQRYNQKRTRATPAKSTTTAPRPAAAAPDDLTQIKGIGPRVASLLADYDISTYADLEHASTQQLREIVALGGILPPATLDSWPAQAAYATRGDWQGLATYNQRRS